MNTKEITHLRNLADFIAIRPDKTGRFLKSTLEIVTSSSGRWHKARSLDDPFVVRLNKMQKDLGKHPDRNHVKNIAEKYSTSEDTLERRTGEILLWGLENHQARQERRR